jgi:hypothetical protein
MKKKILNIYSDNNIRVCFRVLSAYLNINLSKEKREISRGQARYLSSQVLLYSTASYNSSTPNFLLQTLNPKHNFHSVRESLLWSLFDCLKSYCIGFVDHRYLTRLLLNLPIIATKVGISFSLYPLFLLFVYSANSAPMFDPTLPNHWPFLSTYRSAL